MSASPIVVKRGGPTVVKLGGSLLSEPGRLRGWLARLASGALGPCLIVPGGGPFAEAVRTAQGALGFDDALAHRLALDAMGRMAEVFCDLEPGLETFAALPPPRRSRAGPSSVGGGRALVWDPVGLRAGHPDIPESWDVTSDSLALWLAREVAAPACLLVKSAPAPSGSGPMDWARMGLVDAAVPAFAARYSGEIRIEGPAEGRVAA